MNMRTADESPPPSTNNQVLYTIGYEKRSLAEYISILTSNEVALVIDVRKNPLSRKKGFSKRAFAGALSDAGIAYRHLPALGIASSLRQNLKSEDDYRRLFQTYEDQILPVNAEALDTVEELIRRFDRVALTCFELDHTSCHRHCVAKVFSEKYAVLNL